MLTQCKYVGVKPVFFEGDIFVENREVECKLVADYGKEYCPRHELMMSLNMHSPERWQCVGCKRIYATTKVPTECFYSSTSFSEIPVEGNI